MKKNQIFMMLGLLLSASFSVFAQTSLCTETSASGCQGTFTLTTTGGGTITVNAASDGESSFDPFGAGLDTSDGIQFIFGGAGVVTVTNLSPAWLATATPNTFVLPATTKCGSENEPSCEPVGDFVFSAPFTTKGFYTITDNDGGISDYVVFGNTGPGGKGEITFYSDPNRFAPTMLVRYASNLITGGDAVVDLTNTGSSASAVNCSPSQGCVGPAQNNINGNVCVNIYAFAADEQEVACCSCLVTPNALWSASVKTALLNSTLTPSFPNEVVIKMISTAPNQKTVDTVTTQSCNAATIGLADLQPSVVAWGTSTHGVPTATGPNFTITETPFSNATLSGAEIARDVQECQFIQILGSGQFGICKGCSNVGLGANAQ
jgi:hypothetical protein